MKTIRKYRNICLLQGYLYSKADMGLKGTEPRTLAYLTIENLDSKKKRARTWTIITFGWARIFFFFRFFPSSRIFPKEHLLQHTHTFLWAQCLQGTAECLQVTFILVKIILSVMDNKGKAVSTQWPYTVRVYKDGMEDQILRTQLWQEHLTEKECALCSSFCASFLHRLRGLTMWLTRSPY